MADREREIERFSEMVYESVKGYREAIVEARDKYHRTKDMEQGDAQAQSWDDLRELERREQTALDAILFLLVKLTNEVKRREI